MDTPKSRIAPAKISDLLAFIEKLKAAHIHYALADHTDGAIMILISVPGERWEVEFHGNGEIGVEVFVSQGGVRDAVTLEHLFERFTD
jgi:hypothetical protein